MLKEFAFDRACMDALCHEIVTPITQHAHDLGCQSRVQNLACSFDISTICFGDRSVPDVAARSLTQGLHVGKKWLLSVTIWFFSHCITPSWLSAQGASHVCFASFSPGNAVGCDRLKVALARRHSHSKITYAELASDQQDAKH